MQIDLDICSIRSWRWSDKESLIRHANKKKVWLTLRDLFPYPYTVDNAESWLNFACTSLPETNYAISVEDEAVGGIGYSINSDVFRCSAEIGYWLGEDYWGRGITTAAVKAMTKYIFAHHDVCRIHAQVFESNRASIRVLEKCGYDCEARLKKSVIKDNVIMDHFIYVKFRD